MRVPSSPYGTLTGELFSYTMTPTNLIAFETSPLKPSKCILLGGLSDGLLPTPYTQALSEQLPDHWSLVQPLLQSSYTGFGHGTLDRDVQDLQALLLYLQTHRQAESFALIGHSTGCQCIVHYLKHCVNKGPEMDESSSLPLRLAVLQAPVSDREHAATMSRPAYAHFLQVAQEMRTQDKWQEMMPRDAFWAPITAERYLDLQERGGRDDYFSSDYSEDELVDRLHHVGLFGRLQNGNSFQCCVAYSGSDEYVPDHVDKEHLTQRLVDAMNHKGEKVAHSLYLPKSNHNLSNSESERAQFVQHIVQLLQK